MRHKTSPVTFEKILSGEINLDKARRLRSSVLAPGYQWIIHEFDYQTWTFTGRQVTAQIEQLLKIDDGDVDIASINQKYIFFKFVIL